MEIFDIRAEVVASVGGTQYDVISGSISDSYIQESGLITTSGTIEVYGVTVPTTGSTVTITYKKKNLSRSIPRNLNVISAFADPFKGTSSISVGCLLTLKANASIAPDAEEPVVVTANQLNCINDYEYPPFSDFPPPIYAHDIFLKCVEGIGLAYMGPRLTNVFYIEKFVFDSPYIDIMNDLLLSESMYGYIEAGTGVLIGGYLSSVSGAGGNLTPKTILDISEINSGDIPAQAVFVRYNTLVLEPEDPNEKTEEFNEDYTFSESTGDPVTVNVTGENGGTVASGSYIPYSTVYQEYGEDLSWDPSVCIVFSAKPEGPDLSDSVVYKEERERLCLAAVNERYAASAASNGLGAGGDIFRTADKVTKTWYEYDDYGSVVLEKKQVYEPMFAVAGKMNFYWYQNNQLIGLTSTLYLVEEVITQYSYEYPPLPANPYPPNANWVEFNKNYTIEKSREANKTTTTVTEYKHPLYYTDFQHAKNLIDTEQLGIATTTNLLYLILALNLRKTNRTVDVQVGKVKTAAVYRPKKKERTLRNNGYRLEETSETQYTTGSGASNTFKEYSMPYQDMDRINPYGIIIKSKAKEKARTFGRLQNKLALGHRYGMNVQSAPENFPSKPYGLFGVSLGSGGGANYISDGMTYTFSESGVVASCDGLVANGIFSGPGGPFFPTSGTAQITYIEPDITDNTPSNYLDTIPDIGSTPQIELNAQFPLALNNEAVLVQSTNEFWVSNGSGTWTNIGTFIGESYVNPTVIPIFDEIHVFNFTVKVKCYLRFFNYSLTILTIPGPMTVRIAVSANPAAIADSMVVTTTAPSSTETGSLSIPSPDVNVVASAAVMSSIGDPNAEYINNVAVVVTTTTFPSPGAPVSGPVVNVIYSFDGTNGSSSISSNDPYLIPATFYGNTSDPLYPSIPVLSSTQQKFGTTSLYFDGSSYDYVEFDAPFAIGSYEFTIEFWMYIPSTDPTGDRVAEVYSLGRGSELFIQVDTASSARTVAVIIGQYGGTLSNWTMTNTGAFNYNEWTHVCVTRHQGEIWLAVNGIFQTSDHSSWGAGGLAPIPYNYYIPTIKHGFGNANETQNAEFFGYIDEFRLTIGNAVYDNNNFTPRTTPFPQIDQTPLVFGFEGIIGNALRAESPYEMIPAPETFGNPEISQTEKRFYTSSMYFNAEGSLEDNNSINFINPLRFGADDYCIEFWLYVPSTHPEGWYLTPITFGAGFSIDMNVNTSNYAPYNFIFYHYAAETSGNEEYFGPGGEPTIGGMFDTWTHVAAYRKGGKHLLAVNGVLDENYMQEALVDVFNFDSDPTGRECCLGSWRPSPNSYCLLQAYIDDVRLTAGNAVYPETNFTPPSAPFSNPASGLKFIPSLVSVTVAPQGFASPGSGAGAIFEYLDFNSTSGLNLISTYQIASGFLYLTDSVSNDVGNVWRATPTTYNSSFSVEWRFECTNGSGADGFTLQWHTANNVNGGSGGTCGRVENSSVIHAISFNTFFGQRVTWYKNNSWQAQENCTLSGNGFNQNVYYWFDYDHGLSQAKIYYSTSPTKPASASHTFSSFTFDGTGYYMGFGAACGGATNVHILKSWKAYTL